MIEHSYNSNIGETEERERVFKASLSQKKMNKERKKEEKNVLIYSSDMTFLLNCTYP
jgi:nickel-dependent lactate racemase